MLQSYQLEFLRVCLERKILRFGTFTLKSGRQSPYFFNAGGLLRGDLLQQTGNWLAQRLVQSELEVGGLFGPAYKGIPLAVSLAIALADRGRSLPVAHDRKEAKDHGEGGILVGQLASPLLLVDDVLSAGTSARSSMEALQAAGHRVKALMVLLDRQERGRSEKLAAEELRSSHGIETLSLISLDDLVRFAQDADIGGEVASKIADYRAQWGVVQ